jgi:anti-sigma factor RsiW
MNCAGVQERLLLYLAGELGPSERAKVAQHLEQCARCAALAEKLADTQECVEAALSTPVEAPPALDARVMEAVRRLPIPRPAADPGAGRSVSASRRLSWLRVGVRPRLAFMAAVLCVGIAAFAAGSWYAARTSPAGRVAAPALDLALLGNAHRRALQAPIAAEIRASGPRQLAQALAPRLPFPVAVVDLPSEGMRLVGGSDATLHGVPVAALQYDWKGERISLFQMEARALAPAALGQVVVKPDSYFVRKMGGLSYVAWSFGRTNCVMVARAVPMHLLFRLACHASEKLERT